MDADFDLKNEIMSMKYFTSAWLQNGSLINTTSSLSNSPSWEIFLQFIKRIQPTKLWFSDSKTEVIWVCILTSAPKSSVMKFPRAFSMVPKTAFTVKLSLNRVKEVGRTDYFSQTLLSSHRFFAQLGPSYSKSTPCFHSPP